eukprot:4266933-Alexandrium_andersonii.AAC.1
MAACRAASAPLRGWRPHWFGAGIAVVLDDFVAASWVAIAAVLGCLIARGLSHQLSRFSPAH